MSNISDPFIQSVQALTESLRTSFNTAIQTVTAATTAACRRAVLTSLARACAAFQPTSSNQVTQILYSITPLFDAEILYAADNNDFQTFTTMRVLRSSVVTDLQIRGSNLPALITVTTQTTTPSAVLAYGLYDDATRAAELLSKNPQTIHPLFMGTSLEALSS
jgi:prophage DNA circulation protein